MLLFSTVLSINNTLTQEKFIELVIEWNQNSPHDDNVIPNLNWNGERNVRFEYNRLSLTIEEYRNRNIIAVRYEKIDDDGAIWDTDYIMNFNEMKMCIQLDRSFKEEALVLDEKFSTPHFISMLIDKGYLKDDNSLPILNTPTIIQENNLHILTDVINGTKKYNLPIVYVSKNSLNYDPVDIWWLSKRLKGVAHVFVQSNKRLNKICREICSDKNEYNGAIGIYYPNEAIGHKRFLYYAYSGYDSIFLNKVVKSVIHYAVSQNVDSLYTWQGVRNALLTDRLASQREERLQAEQRMQRTEEDVNQILEAFDADFKDLQKQVEDLTKTIESLRVENQWMRTKLNASENDPLLYFGEEEDFYPGEIKDLILSILNDNIKNVPNGSRREHVLRDIIKNNDFQRLSDTRKKRIKTALKGYTRLTIALRQELTDLGFEITEEGKHYKLTYYGDPRYMTTVGKTVSDHCAGDNNAMIICRDMF